jgi:hypothetical protein
MLFALRSKHSVSVTETSRLMLYVLSTAHFILELHFVARVQSGLELKLVVKIE